LRAYMGAEDRRTLFPVFKRFPKIANQSCAIMCNFGAEMIGVEFRAFGRFGRGAMSRNAPH